MRTKFTSFLLAIICYTPTLVNINLAFIYLVISLIGGYCLLDRLKSKKILKSDYYLLFFLFLSVLIFIFGDGIRENISGKSKNDYLPYTIFIVTTIFFARFLNREVFKYIFIFILIEISIGLLEYVFGVPYIIEPLTKAETEFGSTDILYYNKVYGLSAVTSVFAQKVFIGILLLYFLKIEKYIKIFLLICFTGLLITFNRTAIVSSLFFLGLIVMSSYKKMKFNYKFILIISFFIICAIVYKYIDILILQFFKGKSDIDYSGRDVIFENFWIFIQQNILFGNFVQKVWMELTAGKIYHGHNSFLETLASLGLILFILLIIYFLQIIKRKSLIYILPILLYSFFQYGILWGVSLLDIVFFFIIFSYHKYGENALNETERISINLSEFTVTEKIVS